MKTDWAKLLGKIDGDIARTERRLEDLRAARDSLQPLLDGQTGRRAGTAARPGKRGRAAPTAGRRARSAAARLPVTGGTFWLDVLGDEKRTGREIVDLAMAELKLGDEHRDAIYSRAANWFNGAVKKSIVEVVEQRDGANVYRKS